MQEIELELERRPGPSQGAGRMGAPAAEPAPPGSGAAAGPAAAAAAGEAGGSRVDEVWEDEEEHGGEASESDNGSAEEGLAGGSEGGVGGGYNLRSSLRGGRLSASPGTRASRGERPAYDPAGEGGSESGDGANR